MSGANGSDRSLMPSEDGRPNGRRTPSSSWVRRALRSQHAWAVAAIAALIVVNVLKDPGYLSIRYVESTGAFVGNVIDIARAAAPLLLLAAGMCLVIASGGIDLSVGSMMAVAGAVAMELLDAAGAPDSVTAAVRAVGLALVITALLGLVNGVLVAYLGLQPFITTLVMMLAGRGLAKVITSGQNTNAVNAPYRWLATGRVLGLPVVVLLAAGLSCLVAVVVRRTALGMMIESIGINAEASRLAGLNRRGLLVAVYTVSALLAGVAGIFATGAVMTVNVSQTGSQIELDAILAVVIGGTSLAGGTFSLGGAAIGAVLIATLDKTVVFLGVPAAATPAFKAAVIIVLYIAQSQRFRAGLGRLRARRAEHGGSVATP